MGAHHGRIWSVYRPDAVVSTTSATVVQSICMLQRGGTETLGLACQPKRVPRGDGESEAEGGGGGRGGRPGRELGRT